MSKKVSVLICSYNSWKYIFDTIKSVLNQSYVDFELLILDNDSKDDTVKNIKSFSTKRIKLFESKINYWPYGWLNYLLEKSEWDYIAILDHDDLWAKNKLEIQVDFLEKNLEFVWCGTETVMYYESDKKYFLYYLKERNNYTIHSSLLFRKWDYKYDDKVLYFADAYFQKFALCKWQNLIYNIKEPLTFHLIKDGFNNLTYTWFKLNTANIKRLFEVHSITLYAFLALWYEVSRYFIIKLKIAKTFPNFFKFFDRLPYKTVWGWFRDFEEDREVSEKFSIK
jgi:glycosyltransferase involved in cell wall biosynthesis